MPGPIYTYSIANDTLNGKLDAAAFEKEYLDSTIPIKLLGLWSIGDTLSVNTYVEISSYLTDLDALVSNHTGEPLPSDADLVVIENQDGSKANFPLTSMGTPIVQPNVVPSGHLFYGTGAFDDITNGLRGKGPQIVLKTDSETTLKGRFLEYIYILGGTIISKNAEIDDWISLHLEAPASVPTVNGSNTGNCNIVGPMIVPADGDGTHDIDCSTIESGQINLNLTPVPNPAGLGKWDWDPDLTPSIFPNEEGKGTYDLYIVTIPLVRQANRYPALYHGNVTPEAAVKAKKVLPHWEWVFTGHRGSVAGEVEIAIRLDAARVSTL